MTFPPDIPSAKIVSSSENAADQLQEAANTAALATRTDALPSAQSRASWPMKRHPNRDFANMQGHKTFHVSLHRSCRTDSVPHVV